MTTMTYPDLRADERTTLEQFLDHYRNTIVRIFAGLASDKAAMRVLPATNMTAGGIVKHLASVEDNWFQRDLLGVDLPEPWASAPSVKDWPFHSAGEETVDDLLALYREACERSRAAAASFGSLDSTAARPSFGKGPVSLRWIYVHMIDETARHAGHLDLMHDAIVIM